MKVCSYKGLSIVILLRAEHCPPHVHVNAGSWSARLQFSFWHNDIELWDVVPLSRRPPLAVLEGLCRSLEQPAHLRRARGDLVVEIANCLSRQSVVGQPFKRGAEDERRH
jgi:hypothetical protein